jgi:hypothetical protein
MEDRSSPSLKDLKSFELEEVSGNGDDLIFDSKFESGNLHGAFRRRGTNEYHLFISNDTNSLGYNQWFYFSIRNAQRAVKYTFRIVNYVTHLLCRKKCWTSIATASASPFFR